MVNQINLNPQKGFRDLYPAAKSIQNFIFGTLQGVADRMGYEQYDGPLVEEIDIYLQKTSKELIDRQTFQIKDKKDKTLVLRPEMTPSLARMIAKSAQELTYPFKAFNWGLRYRYEAPQKGREREFYQADFDIVGAESIVSDAEIIKVAATIFLAFGAKQDSFKLLLNSRTFMNRRLSEIGIKKDDITKLLNFIDRKDKIPEDDFISQVESLNPTSAQMDALNDLLNKPIDPDEDPYFKNLFELLGRLNVSQFCQINPQVVRGLDYYTGLVFEVKEQGGMTRSLLGGGRYDNLVSQYNDKVKIPGVGFATSDVVIWEFLKDKGLLPNLRSKKTDFLVTVFNPEMLEESINVTEYLLSKGISAEIYLDPDKKMDRQLKYADKNQIPFVIIIGPEEKEKNEVKVKNMKSGEQKTMTIEDLLNEGV